MERDERKSRRFWTWCGNCGSRDKSATLGTTDTRADHTTGSGTIVGRRSRRLRLEKRDYVMGACWDGVSGLERSRSVEVCGWDGGGGIGWPGGEINCREWCSCGAVIQLSGVLFSVRESESDRVYSGGRRDGWWILSISQIFDGGADLLELFEDLAERLRLLRACLLNVDIITLRGKNISERLKSGRCCGVGVLRTSSTSSWTEHNNEGKPGLERFDIGRVHLPRDPDSHSYVVDFWIGSRNIPK